MAETWKDAEAEAPIMNEAIRPLSAPTLQFMSETWWQHYGRATDGSLRLSWVNIGDPEVTAYAEHVASGALRVLPKGETPASVAAGDARHVQLSTDAAAELKALDAQQTVKREAQLKAAQARLRAQQEQELERLRKSYGL